MKNIIIVLVAVSFLIGGCSNSSNSNGLTSAEKEKLRKETLASYDSNPAEFASYFLHYEQVTGVTGLPANPHDWTSSDWDRFFAGWLIYAEHSGPSGGPGGGPIGGGGGEPIIPTP